MLFIGIDVASKKHDITIINQSGSLLSEPFTIDNSLDGLKKLHHEISSHMELFSNIHIGLEATGIYSNNIRDFLSSLGFHVYVINPILTYHSRMASSVRNTKTDKIDALSIARFLLQNYCDLKPYIPSVYTFSELKSLSRLRLDKLKLLSKAKMEFTRLLHIIFPEFLDHFDQHSLWAIKLFTKYPTPQKIAAMHHSTLLNMIKIKGDRVVAAEQIKLLAQSTIGKVSITNRLLMSSILADIKHYSSQIKAIDKELDILMEPFDFITSIPGVGNVVGAIILGEIGHISRFDSSSKLLAFSGLDPSIYESGTFKSNTCHISKRGSKYLRTAIFTATKVACIGNVKDNQFQRKYLKKRSEGKHHYSAICNVAKNMINTIFAMLKSGSYFEYAV